LHKWKPEEELVVSKEVLAAFTALSEGKFPEGVELCASYRGPRQACRAFCLWKARTQEDLEKLFDKYMPTLKKGTEFVPVLQNYPPTMEYVLSLAKAFIEMASK
jgi:hypothetical protein